MLPHSMCWHGSRVSYCDAISPKSYCRSSWLVHRGCLIRPRPPHLGPQLARVAPPMVAKVLLCSWSYFAEAVRWAQDGGKRDTLEEHHQPLRRGWAEKDEREEPWVCKWPPWHNAILRLQWWYFTRWWSSNDIFRKSCTFGAMRPIFP